MLYVFGMSGRMPLSGRESAALVRPAPAVQRSRAVDAVAKGVDDTAGGPVRPALLAAYGESRAELPQQHHRVHQVHEVMRRPALTVPVAAAWPLAWALLDRHAVQQLAVVNPGGVLVGQLLRDDLLGPAWPALVGRPGDAAAAAAAWSAERLQWAARSALEDWQARCLRSVGALMRSPVPAVATDTTLRRVAALLIDTGLSGLPVADERGAPIGWIGRRELLGAVAAEPPLDLWG